MLQVVWRVTCVSSFADVPHLQLSYSLQGQQVAQNLMLPIVVSKFCTPPDNPVPKEVFFGRWRAIAGVPVIMQRMPAGIAHEATACIISLLIVVCITSRTVPRCQLACAQAQCSIPVHK